MTHFLIVVAGPTAVGKTELCVRLAEHFQTEILSADSRQLYREMNIGTAKPSPDEMRGIPHHFIDTLPITAHYNAADFERDGLAKLETIFQTHQTAILTGGSTLYIQMLTEGMDEMPAAEPEIRQQLQEVFQTQGLASLLKQLDILDPVYAATVDRANPQRIMRALEVCLQTGLPYSSFRQGKKAARPFRMLKIGLNRDRAELYARIDQRMDAMLQNGLVEEAQRLYAYKENNALQTVGYKEVFGWLEGQYDEAEMVRLLKRNTRHYAKRQLTWFTRDPEYHWFHPQDFDQIVAWVEQQVSEP